MPVKTQQLKILFFLPLVQYMETLMGPLMKKKNLILKTIMHIQNSKPKK